MGAPPVFDGRKLAQPWWSAPVMMTGIITLFLGTITFMVTGPRGPAQPWYLYIGLFFGLCGAGYGFGYTARARTAIDRAVGITWEPADGPLTERVHRLAAQLGMPPPRVGVCPMVNAFAMKSSDKDASVVIGLPLIQHLTSEELDAVIAHELGHIVSNDSYRMQYACGYQEMFGAMVGGFATRLVQQLARTNAGAQLGYALSDLARATVFLGSECIVMAMSRRREYYADAVGALLTSPAAMIGALEKIHQLPSTPTPAEREYGYLMFMSTARVFKTHPSLESRKNALINETKLNSIRRLLVPDTATPATPSPRPYAHPTTPPPAPAVRKPPRRRRPLTARQFNTVLASAALTGVAGGVGLILWLVPDPVDPEAVAAWLNARPSGPLACWGGGPSMIKEVPPRGTYVSYAVNGHTMCGVEKDKGLQCATHLVDPEWWRITDAMRRYPKGEQARSVALGNTTAYLVDKAGQVKRWGLFSKGSEEIPVDIARTRFLEVKTADDDFICGMTERHGLRCWGTYPHIYTEMEKHLPSRGVTEWATGGAHVCWADERPNAFTCVAWFPKWETKRFTTPAPLRTIHVDFGGICAIDASDTRTCWGKGKATTTANIRAFSGYCTVAGDGRTTCTGPKGAPMRAADVWTTTPANLRLQSIIATNIACGMVSPQR